jgi:hypothetical protein
MITLENNELHFNFPEITAELHRLADAEIARLTAQFAAEDRNAAFKHVLKSEYYAHDIDACYMVQAKNALLEITPEKIATAIRQRLAKHGAFGFSGTPRPAVEVSFQRTLRIPDDGKSYPLPPGLSTFPLEHVDDHAKSVPPAWTKRGGVMMPMHQAEALWLHFSTHYPCALKVAAGKINAVSGKPWSAGLRKTPQDYVVLPGQPWLDGYCVEKGLIRQFVAMPLGKGYSAEEQITGKAEHGGVQLQVYPLRASVYFKESVRAKLPKKLADILASLLPVPELLPRPRVIANMRSETTACYAMAAPPASMGLGAGGLMHQDIYEDERPLADYDLAVTSRCFVHLCNSAAWKAITGSPPPSCPITAQTYARYNLPWFDYYRDDLDTVNGAPELANLKTVAQLHNAIETVPLPENGTVAPRKLVQFGNARRPNEVLEWHDDETARG